MPALTQRCNKCGLNKHLEEFYLHHSNDSGYSHNCKECDKAYNKDYCKNNRDLINNKRNERRRKQRKLGLKRSS